MRPKPDRMQLYATGPSVVVAQILGLFSCWFQAMKNFCKTSENRFTPVATSLFLLIYKARSTLLNTMLHVVQGIKKVAL